MFTDKSWADTVIVAVELRNTGSMCNRVEAGKHNLQQKFEGSQHTFQLFKNNNTTVTTNDTVVPQNTIALGNGF